ncbi:MAG: acetyl-CoA carboxylase carboxyltransferase subunit alpha [Pseudomonadota bacterium]
MLTHLDFEKPIAELEGKIEELRHLATDGEVNIEEEVGRLQTKVDKLLRAAYTKLTPAQRVQVARHPSRPHFSDYVERLIDGFMPLAGDRTFAEDSAIIGGLGRFRGYSVMVIGQEKGRDTDSRLKHNFGMAKPEGYRKARRLMRLADRFALPIITVIDTAGAYPGVASEERGVAESIARCIETSLQVQVPVIAVIIGEGGSGGAIAIGTADRVLMLEHAIYSVISPEGCASILWRSSSHANDAAQALKLTAPDLKDLKIVDKVIDEPIGGAHRHLNDTVQAVGNAIDTALEEVRQVPPSERVRLRRDKFLEIGTG